MIVVEVLVVLVLGIVLRARMQAAALESSAPLLVQKELDTSASATHRQVIIVTIGMFSGYAALSLLQHHLMGVMEKNMPTDTTKDAKTHFEDWFKHAATCNLVGNFIFRIGHNFFFACVRPRYRVYIALTAMLVAHLIIAIFLYVLEHTEWWIVVVAYFIGGIGVGTFESNLLSCITPLGHDTKTWAILGMPVGFMSISVVGFLLRSPPPIGANLPVVYLHFAVAVACVIGMAVFCFTIPDQHQEGHKFSEFVDGLRYWNQWLPTIAPHCIALMIQMYAVTFFTSFPFYVYNDEYCPDSAVLDSACPYKAVGGECCNVVSMIDGTKDTTLMDHDKYFVSSHRCHLGCILLKMPAISLRAGGVERAHVHGGFPEPQVRLLLPASASFRLCRPHRGRRDPLPAPHAHPPLARRLPHLLCEWQHL
eukprot:COSAG04_NODE_1741_length_5729_cov_3.082416_4_plen_422_part_00